MSGGIDTSIYKLPEQPNALNTLTGLVGLQGALQGQEIQRQAIERFKAEQAGGNVFLQAIDPTTGIANPNKLGIALRATPAAALAAPQLLERQQSLQGGQISNETARTSLAATRDDRLRSGIGALVAKPDLTAQDAINFVQQQVRAGVIPAERGQSVLQEIQAIGDNRKALRDYAYGHFVTASGPAVAAPETVGITREGAPITGTRGGAVRAITSPTATTATGAAPSAAAPGGIVTSLPPGVGEAQTKTAAASAEQGIQLQRQAEGVPTRKAMLGNLEADLEHFTSGQGADWQAVAKNFANRNVLPTAFQFDPQSIASQEAFNKQATQLAQQQFAALGGTGTDSQLSSAFKSNPNETLSKLGNQQIIQLLKGNEDALAAKNSAWQDWQRKNGPSTYGAFQEDFNKTYNPRVYQAQYMSPDQIKDMRAKMSPAEQSQFLKDYRALKELGYIAPGGRY
jgi:hypothetical protein